MTDTQNQQEPTHELEYDPDDYVSDVWIDELTAAGIPKSRAEQVLGLTFGDPDLTVGDPSSEAVLATVVDALDHYDFESVLEGENPHLNAHTLRERLIEITYAGLTGRLLGPAAAPAEVALDNDGESTVSTADIDWTPAEEEPGIDTGFGDFDEVIPGPGEASQSAAARALGFNSELPISSPELVDAVVASLQERADDDEAVEVRAAAVEALGSIAAALPEEGRRELVETIRRYLADPEPDVRAAAARALGVALGGNSPPTDSDDESSPAPPNADPFDEHGL